jgi:hypothetical protein
MERGHLYLKRPPLLRITVRGSNGMHYVATGRLRGKVKVRGQERILAEAVGFDLLFDREDVVMYERIRE